MTHQIALFAFDRISPFHLSAPCVVFADSHPGIASFSLVVCAVAPGMLATSAGFRIEVQEDLSVMETADTIIIPSWGDVNEPPPAVLVNALQRATERGARVVGLCLGAYVLAGAGLLDGKAATTHWAYAQDFAQRFPKVKLNPAVLYVEEDGVVTSAGTVAAIDCCLHLLREQLGVEAANRVARRLVISPHRQGGQAQFIEQPVPDVGAETRLAHLLDDLRNHLADEQRIDALAARMNMTRRTFTRHFRQLTGEPLGQWLQRERLRFAQHCLENSHHSIERVAELSGFTTPLAFRQHFRQAFGVTPSAWRQMFVVNQTGNSKTKPTP